MCVSSDDDCIYQTITVLYGKYCIPTISTENVDIKIEKQYDYFLVTQGQNSIKTTDPLQALESMIFESCDIQDGIFAIHAGAVAYKERAFIFTASTNTGKTTLTAFLSLNGFEYVTDDCVLIDMQNQDVYPYHKPIHLREGGFQVLKKYNAEPSDYKYIDIQSLQRYIFTPFAVSKDVLKISELFFIERTNDVNSITKIAAFDAMRRLMESPIKPYKLTSDYLRFLQSISKKSKLLQYSDMNYVLNYLKEVTLCDQ